MSTKPGQLHIALAATVVIGVGLIAWLYVQDNGAGRLETDAGIRHFFIKAEIAAGFIAAGSALLIAIGLVASIIRRRFPRLGK